MPKINIVKDQAKHIRYSAPLLPNHKMMGTKTEKEQLSYLELIRLLSEKDDKNRGFDQNDNKRQFPLTYNLDFYDHSHPDGMDKKQLVQLRKLQWLEQHANVIIMGPAGSGKTFIAGGLGFDAVNRGYRVFYKTMAELMKVLKMQDRVKSATLEYSRILKSQLLVIDDFNLSAVSQFEATAFNQLIDELKGKSSIVITTSKKPDAWTDGYKDLAITKEILDSLLLNCETILL